MKVTPAIINRIATDAARSVTASGSVGGDAHNIQVIALAIRTTLAHAARRKGKR